MNAIFKTRTRIIEILCTGLNISIGHWAMSAKNRVMPGESCLTTEKVSGMKLKIIVYQLTMCENSEVFGKRRLFLPRLFFL